MTNLTEILSVCEKATLPIPGYPGYEADNEGNIWSINHNWRRYGKRILTAFFNKYGYLKVRLSIDGKRVNKPVHRLVCLAFHGEPVPDKPLVRHLDGNKTNNTPDNLCWGTPRENEDDAIRLQEHARGERNGASIHRDKVSAGVRKWMQENPERIPRGDRCYNSKVTNEQAKAMQKAYGDGVRPKDIANLYGLNYYTTYAICRGYRYGQI